MKLLVIFACLAVIYSNYRVNGNWMFENENNVVGGWDKRSLASLAKNNQHAINPAYFYNMPTTPTKRYLGSLKKQKQPKRSIPTEPGNPVVMKMEFKEDLKPVLTEYVQKLYKNTYDPRKVELFLDNLARAIYDRNEDFSLDSLKSLVRSGYFKKEPLMRKRNIAALTRSENQSFSEIRPLAPRSVDDSELYQQYLEAQNDQIYDAADQVAPADEEEMISADTLPGDSDDRDIAVEKRYLGQARGRGKPRVYIGNTPRTRQSTAPRRIPNNSDMIESWTPESEWSPE